MILYHLFSKQIIGGKSLGRSVIGQHFFLRRIYVLTFGLKGFTFLNIPRSYYGVLTEDMLVKGIACNGNNRPDVLLTAECAGAAFEACRSSGLLNDDSSVDLDATADSIRETLRERIPRPHQDELHLNLDAVIETILRSRYVNLLKLLGVRRLSFEWISFHSLTTFKIPRTICLKIAMYQ